MSIANLIKCTGLVTYGSELSFPEGSLRQALNVNIDENGVITKRRGFNDYKLPTTGVANLSKLVDQVMEYKGSMIRQFDSSLEYEDSSNVFQSVTGTFNPVRSGYRTKHQEANSNFFFTSDEGIKKISVSSQANLNANMVTDAGGLKAGYAEGLIVPTTGGFLPAESKVAYRVLFGTRDNNNNLIYGSPSARFIITNFSEDQVIYEVQTISFDTGTGGAVAGGDYVIFYAGTTKYVAWFNTTGSDTAPKTADTIGGTYIEVDVQGITSNDDSLAAVLANEIASSVSSVDVTIDSSTTPDTVVITQNSTEGDIASPSTNDATKMIVATTITGDTASGSDANVSITAIVPEGATTEYFYQIYRTAPITVTTGLTLNDLDPGDEMNLVYEAGLTTAEIAANEITVTDTTPESFRDSGLPLYTNEASGEGILQANDTPPIALDLELFKNYMFYANTKQRHQAEFTIVSVDNFVSGSTKFIVGNEDITRYYTFTGTAEINDINIDSIPAAGDYINLYSAGDKRQYYIYFGDTSDDPEVSGATSYRVSLSGYTPADTTLANRESLVVDIAQALIDNVDFNLSPTSDNIIIEWSNNGYTTGVTNGVGSSITIGTPSVDGTGELSTDVGGDVLLSGLTSVGQAIDETARSLVKIISSDADSPVNAYYLSTGEELPGNILLEARSLEDKTFYIAIEEASDTAIGDEFTPELPYSQQVEQIDGNTTTTTITLTGHPYSNGDSVFVGIMEEDYDAATAYTSAANDAVLYNGNIYLCILDTTGNAPSGDTSDNTQWQYISPAFSASYTISGVTANTFDITVASPTSTVAFEPTYSTIFSPDVESDNEELKNRVYYSKFRQPEAVPRINFIDIGPQDSEILRILALRDELYVLKEDGIYVISGTSAPDWSVRLVDSAQILAADSAVVLNNQIYCLTDQGVTRISGSSAAVISRGIENRINDVVDSGFDYASNTFGIAYENDRAYILFTPQSTTDTSATQAYRYNIFEQTWSRWEYSATCGLVMKRDNKLYLGNADRNYVSQERKNKDRTDYADRNFSASINAGGIEASTPTEIELSSLVDVALNDVIVQTQEVSIYYLNWHLLKRMDAFDTGITPPSGSTMYDSFYASTGDNLPAKMQALNDYLRTLDAANITSKSFTASNIRTQTELLVTELNDAATITKIKTYRNPETVTYEAHITSLDTLRNKATVHKERPFIEGSIEVYKGYACTVEWNPLHFGNPSTLKQIPYMTIMFDQNNFSAAVAKFYSDASQSAVEVPFSGKGLAYWGDSWGGKLNLWGGKGNDIPSRRPVPYGKQKCRYISIAFEHKIARESFRVIGVSADVREISGRAYRELA